MTPQNEREILAAAGAIKRKRAKERRKARVPAKKKLRAAVRANADPGQRKPRRRDKAYLSWIGTLPCLICGKPGPSEAAHVRAGYAGEPDWPHTGMAQKPSDWRCVPLCAAHHREGPDAQHRTSERDWYKAHGLYPPEVCGRLRYAYLNNPDSGADVVAEIRARS